MTDHLAEAKELLGIAADPATGSNEVEWLCQREAGVHALVGILEELRRLVEGRDQFHREVLEVLTKSTKPKVCGMKKRGPQPVVGETFVFECALDRGHSGCHNSKADGLGTEWT